MLSYPTGSTQQAQHAHIFEIQKKRRTEILSLMGSYVEQTDLKKISNIKIGNQ